MITTCRWRRRLYKQINGLTVYPQDILLLTRQVMGITIYWELQVTEPWNLSICCVAMEMKLTCSYQVVLLLNHTLVASITTIIVHYFHICTFLLFPELCYWTTMPPTLPIKKSYPPLLHNYLATSMKHVNCNFRITGYSKVLPTHGSWWQNWVTIASCSCSL